MPDLIEPAQAAVMGQRDPKDTARIGDSRRPTWRSTARASAATRLRAGAGTVLRRCSIASLLTNWAGNRYAAGCNGAEASSKPSNPFRRPPTDDSALICVTPMTRVPPFAGCPPRATVCPEAVRPERLLRYAQGRSSQPGL
jgi:hypothetical protein